MPDDASRSDAGNKAGGRDGRIVIRSTDAFRRWLSAFAQRERTTKADLIERALVGHAKATRFQVDPPRR